MGAFVDQLILGRYLADPGTAFRRSCGRMSSEKTKNDAQSVENQSNMGPRSMLHYCWITPMVFGRNDGVAGIFDYSVVLSLFLSKSECYNP